MRNHSYENDFDLHGNETACRTHFRMKGFARRLLLKQRHILKGENCPDFPRAERMQEELSFVTKSRAIQYRASL